MRPESVDLSPALSLQKLITYLFVVILEKILHVDIYIVKNKILKIKSLREHEFGTNLEHYNNIVFGLLDNKVSKSLIKVGHVLIKCCEAFKWSVWL